MGLNDQQLKTLNDWTALLDHILAQREEAGAESGTGAAQETRPSDEQLMATKATFVLELTRVVPSWSKTNAGAKSEGDGPLSPDEEGAKGGGEAGGIDQAFEGPEEVLSRVENYPSANNLSALRDGLDYGSIAWASLFCKLGGPKLLLHAALVHSQPAYEASPQFVYRPGEKHVVSHGMSTCHVTCHVHLSCRPIGSDLTDVFLLPSFLVQ